MVRAEPRNNRTAGIDTNHSTIFTLLQERNVIYVGKGGYSSNGKIVSAELFPLMAKYSLLFTKFVKADHN